MFSGALVTIAPGAMREIHWHQQDEWNFFLQGSARITVYAAQGDARTLDYTSGSVGYIPMDMTHYIQNTGDEPVVVLEMLQADHFSGEYFSFLLLDTRPVLCSFFGPVLFLVAGCVGDCGNICTSA